MNYQIIAYHKTNRRSYGSVIYSGYSKREAVRRYREQKGLKGKRVDLHVDPCGPL